MTKIDKSKPVMVTGANGYVASWLVKKLLDEGITVHAAVRNPNDEKKIGHLKTAAANSPGEIKFFAGDLLQAGSYKAAMEGCELVYHTASPFTMDIQDPQKELIDPALKGTADVLNTAKEVASVLRVVVTSSCAAIYTDAIDTVNAPEGRITEEVWNTTASLDYQPYSYSKTLAEKKAWEIEKSQSQWDLVTINVAEAHFRAGYTPEAKGRYITSAHDTDLLEMGAILLPKYGDKYPLPKRAMPKWLLMLIGPMANKLFTRKYIKNNVNIPFHADNSKIKKDLGIEFMPLKETLEDSFQVLIDEGIIIGK